MKALVGIEHREGFDQENNADRWFCNTEPFTAKEGPILISYWAGKAWEKLSQPKYDRLRKKCWTSKGCLITVDESDDNLIKAERLANFTVSPPRFLDATDQPVTNSSVREERH